MAAGVLMLIFSFLAWYKVDESDFFEGQSWNAWSNSLNLFPLATLIAVFGVIFAVEVAASRFGGASLPDRFFNLTLSDSRLLFGILSTLTLIAYFLRSFGDDSSLDKGIGMILTLLVAIAFIVAAVMERQAEPASADVDEAKGGAGQPSPSTIVLLVAGVLILIGSFLAAATSGDESKSAWGEGFFPLYTLPAILGVIVAVQVALTEFTGTRLPAILGLGWSAIRFAFSGWALWMMVSFLIGRTFVEGADVDKGVGFWIMLVAAAGLFVGSIMREKETAGPAAPAAAAPPPPPPPPA